MSTASPVPAPVKQAIEKLKELSEDERARELAEDRQRRLIAYQLERHALLVQGRAEGKAESETEAKLTIVRALLSEGFSVEKTALLTSLSSHEVQALIK